MSNSEVLYDTMVRSKGIINNRKITELIIKDLTIIEISTISCGLDISFDLIVTTNSKESSLNLIRNGIILSDGKIAKIKSLFVETKKESNPFIRQRLDRDDWQEEQFNNLRPDEKVNHNFDKEPIFGMGNSNFNECNRTDPIFRQDSFY